MRISVFAGLLACALIFVGFSTKAGALSLQEIQTNSFETPALQLIEAATNTHIEVKVIEKIESKQKEDNKEIKHKIEEDETLSDIAKEHDTTWKRVFDKNKQIVNPDEISVGAVLTIPGQDEQVPARQLPPVRAVRNSLPPSRAYISTGGSSSGNRYAPGNCTWYVKSRRLDMPNNLGNAYTWFSRAAAQGIPTGYVPRVGAVGQRNNHVVYVERVNGDGTVTISEMNYRSLYAKTTRTVAANYFRYIY